MLFPTAIGEQDTAVLKFRRKWPGRRPSHRKIGNFCKEQDERP
jgi:hypothetical protein